MFLEYAGILAFWHFGRSSELASYCDGQVTKATAAENLALDGRKALQTLPAANKRINRSYLLKESFDPP